ncbi:MAG TPA: hypothetical protein VG734_18765 [Lacunisphaera sp.]|nr:hypothetical protein [Lacunisphaera sp.]
MSDSAASLRSSLSRPATRAVAFVLAGLVAGYLGFVHFTVEEARNVLRHGGYYIMLVTFFCWLVAVWRQIRAGSAATASPTPAGTWAAVGLIGLLTVLAVTHETFRSKILYDEYVLQSTAYNLHFFRDNSAMVRGYEVRDVFVSLDSYLDKRPILFPFLLSLVHDAVGYRTANVFALNIGLYVAGLALVGWLGWKLNRWRGGLLAIGLLGSLPLYAQNASGAGMELLNVCMLLVVMLQGGAWLARPDERTLSGFVLGVVLLVQARYESALYVVPAALLIALGWWRERRLIISGAAIAAPLFLVPVALLQKVISNSPIMWELHENQTSRFSAEYLGGNLRAAYEFFTTPGMTRANSPLLGALAVAALGVVGWRLAARRSRWADLGPVQLSLLAFGTAILAVSTLIMFYYWAALTDPMSARFALPLHLLLVLVIVAAAAWADRRWPVSVVALGAVAVFILGVSAPKQSYHHYSHAGNDELAWEQRVVAARPPGQRLIVTNKSPLPWLIERTPSILLDRAKGVADRLADQLHMPDFSEILVTQGMRPASAEGQYQVPPDEVLPPWFKLELVAERRFGTKLARISRLVAIDLPADYQPSIAPAVGAAAPGRPGQ